MFPTGKGYSLAGRDGFFGEPSRLGAADLSLVERVGGRGEQLCVLAEREILLRRAPGASGTRSSPITSLHPERLAMELIRARPSEKSTIACASRRGSSPRRRVAAHVALLAERGAGGLPSGPAVCHEKQSPGRAPDPSGIGSTPAERRHSLRWCSEACRRRGPARRARSGLRRARAHRRPRLRPVRPRPPDQPLGLGARGAKVAEVHSGGPEAEVAVASPGEPEMGLLDERCPA